VELALLWIWAQYVFSFVYNMHQPTLDFIYKTIQSSEYVADPPSESYPRAVCSTLASLAEEKEGRTGNR